MCPPHGIAFGFSLFGLSAVPLLVGFVLLFVLKAAGPALPESLSVLLDWLVDLCSLDLIGGAFFLLVLFIDSRGLFRSLFLCQSE